MLTDNLALIYFGHNMVLIQRSGAHCLHHSQPNLFVPKTNHALLVTKVTHGVLHLKWNTKLSGVGMPSVI